MNKQTAKKLLLQQKEKLQSTSNHNDTWVFHTASIIAEAFGKDSPEYNYIGQFQFGVSVSNFESNESIRDRIKEKERRINSFLDNCISSVEFKGVKKPDRANFLGNLKTYELIAYLATAGAGILSAGIFIGNYASRVDAEQIRQELKEVRDSLLLSKSVRNVPSENSKKEPQDESHNKKKIQ